jgi:Fe-S cluster biogenesis protein NfuA
MDGGDIEFVRFDEETGIVYVKMKGSCDGCPSSSATLNGGIKRMLEYYVPEVTDVQQI